MSMTSKIIKFVGRVSSILKYCDFCKRDGYYMLQYDYTSCTKPIFPCDYNNHEEIEIGYCTCTCEEPDWYSHSSKCEYGREISSNDYYRHHQHIYVCDETCLNCWVLGVKK